MWAILFASFALATPVAPVLSGAGGYDLSTAQPWAGVDFALHPAQTKGFAPLARLTPAWGFGDRMPIVHAELGFTGTIPQKEATVRLGALVRPTLLFGRYRMPIRFADPTTGKIVSGLQLGGEFVIEFEWRPKAPVTFGLRAGAGSTATDYLCDDETPDPTTCISWNPGFIGGFNFRKRWMNGLSIDAMVGFTSHLAVGYAF